MRGADTDPWIPTVSLISLLNQDPGISEPEFASMYSGLIPGPLDPDNSSASLEQWTWDQEGGFQ
jgi:hypothetical protein